MRSRRGRDLVPTKEADLSRQKSSLSDYEHLSALHLLDEYIAAFTPDRAPIELVESRNRIRNSNNLDELGIYLRSPHKIVRDAANDKIRGLQGLPPEKRPSGYTLRWGQHDDGRIAPQLMAAQGRFASRLYTFDVAEHGLARVPGRLAGNVDDSYPRFTHHLQARRLYDETVKQADAEKRQYPENPNFDISEPK